MSKLKNFIKLILGKNPGWKRAWDIETEEGVRKIEEDYVKKGLFSSGMRLREVRNYREKRKLYKNEEGRKRLIEGLKAIPPWITLVLSTAAIIVSIIAMLR